MSNLYYHYLSSFSVARPSRSIDGHMQAAFQKGGVGKAEGLEAVFLIPSVGAGGGMINPPAGRPKESELTKRTNVLKS